MFMHSVTHSQQYEKELPDNCSLQQLQCTQQTGEESISAVEFEGLSSGAQELSGTVNACM